MNLLDEQEQKKNNGGKRIVLVLLIFSILALIILIYLISLLSGQGTQQTGVFLNGEQIEVTEGLLIINDENNIFISLRDLVYHFDGYYYVVGAHGADDVDRYRRTIRTSNEAIGFEDGSNLVSKVPLNPPLIDNAYFEIESDIFIRDGRMYINVEDLTEAFSMRVTAEAIRRWTGKYSYRN
ncbi:MAG: hypothetical protein FWC79_02745 [Oscillospiraceae bacterium]|nr:hypothetical protein [Oscillospiraceae bacterium]